MLFWLNKFVFVTLRPLTLYYSNLVQNRKRNTNVWFELKRIKLSQISIADASIISSVVKSKTFFAVQSWHIYTSLRA